MDAPKVVEEPVPGAAPAAAAEPELVAAKGKKEEEGEAAGEKK